MKKIVAEQETDERYSLCDRVFNTLLEDIIEGRLPPGTNLIETKLSEELGVSRTPIREALHQLELEGLVKIIPNKGAVVLGISPKDIEDIYTIRIMIEGLAARWAAENITPEELDNLRESIELMEFYTSRNNPHHLLKVDTEFHKIIFKASKSKPLMHTLNMFHHLIQRARESSFQTPGRALKSLEEHKAIFQAISEGKPIMAKRLTVRHIKNAHMNYSAISR